MTAGRETYRRRRIDEEEQENAGGGYPAMNAAAPAALLRSFDWKWIVIGLCWCSRSTSRWFPLAFLLWQSFFTPQTAAKAAEFTLGNYTSAYGSSETLRLFWNSVQFAWGRRSSLSSWGRLSRG